MTEQHEPHWIVDEQGLRAAVAVWLQGPCLFFDTEFVRTDTYFPRPGLLQIAAAGRVYLVDLVAISDFSPLLPLLEAPLIWVGHALSEDLEVLRVLVGRLPERLFDTQIAAALCGLGFSLSFQKLVAELCQVVLEKEVTRTNWCARPLSEAQCRYAVNDVRYLPELYQQLLNRLGQERCDWVLAEGLRQCRQADELQAPERYYQRLKGAWQLRGEKLAILQRVSQWREEQARQRDMPRNRVLSDRACLQIAQARPRHAQELTRLDEIPPPAVRRLGEAIIAQVKLAQAGPQPEPLPQPLPREAGDITKLVRQRVQPLAEQLRIAPELLLARRDLDVIMRECWRCPEVPLPEEIGAWRVQLLSPILLPWLWTV